MVASTTAITPAIGLRIAAPVMQSSALTSPMNEEQATTFLTSDITAANLPERLSFLRRDKGVADDVLVAACDKLGLSGGAAFELTLADIGGDGPECGAVPWDPMGFAEYGKFGSLPAKLAWYRHAEIKHGRVAMAAFVGWLATANGYFFDGFLSRELGIKFADLGTDPLSAWEQMPASGKVQMLLAVGALEVAQETVEPHYLRGGEPGRFPLVRDSVLAPFRQFGIYNGAIKKQLEAQGRTVESLRQEKLLSELKNGRLAMIGMASLYAASVVPDSVPFFKGGIAPFPVG